MPLHPHPLPPLGMAPWRFSGVVYTALLNDPQQLTALGDAVHQPPHKAPPAHPVLALRPRNTLAGDGSAISVPADAPALQTGPGLGLVIGRTACRVPAANALAWVAGYLVANSLSLPINSHYRPAVRQMARDGFCPLGPVVPASTVADPDALAIRLALDGAVVWQGRTGPRLRGVAQLLANVTEFMTLQPGDVLLLGSSADAPLAHAGQTMVVAIDGIGSLHNSLVAEAA
ncbi:MAG: fumarylacetoacetate hydrolase family protein [Aquabacterium sp.]|nr:fumarylacetoacetate hydrolase family protein [Aquabacterium sp.]